MKYAYWTDRERSDLARELEQTSGVVHLGCPSPRMKRLLDRHSPRCIRAYAYRMLKESLTAKVNGTNEPGAEAANFQRPATYWQDLLDHAAKKVGIEIEPDRYAPAHVCDMAKGRRVYPRLVASAVRKLYLEDIARHQGND